MARQGPGAQRGGKRGRKGGRDVRRRRTAPPVAWRHRCSAGRGGAPGTPPTPLRHGPQGGQPRRAGLNPEPEPQAPAAGCVRLCVCGGGCSRRTPQCLNDPLRGCGAAHGTPGPPPTLQGDAASNPEPPPLAAKKPDRPQGAGGIRRNPEPKTLCADAVRGMWGIWRTSGTRRPRRRRGCSPEPQTLRMGAVRGMWHGAPGAPPTPQGMCTTSGRLGATSTPACASWAYTRAGGRGCQPASSGCASRHAHAGNKRTVASDHVQCKRELAANERRADMLSLVGTLWCRGRRGRGRGRGMARGAHQGQSWAGLERRVGVEGSLDSPPRRTQHLTAAPTPPPPPPHTHLP